MSIMHIRHVDLNLIVVFDAIMTEGSLSAAGLRLGLSQSAMSHALSRLRAITGDRLFIRTRKGMLPTPHALTLARPLQAATELCRQAFSNRSGVPEISAERTFLIDLPVGFDLVFVPSLLSAMRVLGVPARVWIVSERAGDVLANLRDGDTELAIDLEPAKGKRMQSKPLYDDEFLICARKGSSVGELTERVYLDSDHVTLRWSRSAPGSPVDARLKSLRFKRKVVAALPTLAGCATVVAESHVLFTIHSRIARILAARFDLQLHPMPIPLERLTVYLVWHQRSDEDPGHKWLRGEFQRIARDL